MTRLQARLRPRLLGSARSATSCLRHAAGGMAGELAASRVLGHRGRLLLEHRLDHGRRVLDGHMQERRRSEDESASSC